MSRSDKLFMGIDLGTQSIKVIIYNPENHNICSEISHPFEVITKDDGSMEQESSWWLAGLKECLDKTPHEFKQKTVAIGISGQQHGFVPLDKDGNVLAPVKLWCDTSTEEECIEIMDAVGGKDACIELTGNAIATGYTASKILWLKKYHPDLYERLDTILLPHDYLNYYLTGNRTMEYGDASGTGLLDIKTRTWSDKIIQTIDSDKNLEQCLPKLIQPDEICGKIRSVIAAELGLSENIIVSSGGGDNMMAAIGTGNIKEGNLTASLGTSGTLFAYSDNPVIDNDGMLAAFCSSTGGWLPLLCTMNCTIATEQMRELLNTDLEQMEQMASNVPPGSDGVITIPFYNGERTPNLPKAKASIFGLRTQNTTKAHMLRSAMEAAIFGLKSGLESFQKQKMVFEQVTLTGGGSKSALWRQITADILNLPVRVFKVSENAAFGAVLQAIWAYQKHNEKPTSLEGIINEHLQEDDEKRCSPNPDAVALYKEFYKEYQSYVKLVSSIYHHEINM